MPEPLKNLYSKTLIDELAATIKISHSHFDSLSFTQAVFDSEWKNKELKQRIRHISQCLHQHLPDSYKTAISILKPVSANFNRFEYIIFQDYVECYGLHDFETSMSALEYFTQFSTAEFAVRAFILQDEKRMMKQMLTWAKSDNYHVRRLASEGCRPRLPWAVSLPAFKKDPSPVLKVLKILMQDDSEYVRRSVANNLNDISKDNPEIVLDWARLWLNKNCTGKNSEAVKNTRRIIKHACRTLLKQGDQNALSLFGFSEAGHIDVERLSVQPTVRFGENLPFTFLMKSRDKELGKCRVEFAIAFAKANGRQSRKLFKICESDYEASEKLIKKYFSFKEITTRKYYPGRHQLAIIINGIERASKPFDLID